VVSGGLGTSFNLAQIIYTRMIIWLPNSDVTSRWVHANLEQQLTISFTVIYVISLLIALAQLSLKVVGVHLRHKSDNVSIRFRFGIKALKHLKHRSHVLGKIKTILCRQTCGHLCTVPQLLNGQSHGRKRSWHTSVLKSASLHLIGFFSKSSTISGSFTLCGPIASQ
jgi:hypothetical protein